jgi:Protein of unknown function (DUF1697)
MTAYVALLRAVNVGGTGALPMPELKAMGEAEVKMVAEVGSMKPSHKSYPAVSEA